MSASITLDKSKPYSTCAGGRTPIDPHYRVAFFQGGRLGKDMVLLPFDVNGRLVEDDGKNESWMGKNDENKDVVYQPLYTPMMRNYLKARLARIEALAKVAPVAGPQLEDEQQPAADQMLGLADSPSDEVDFGKWLRGEAQYQPFMLREAAKKRLNLALSEIYPQLVQELVFEHQIVPRDQVCERLRAYLPAADASAAA